MYIKLSHPTAVLNQHLNITGSKSESNRLLLLQALYPNLEIENLSNSDDTKAMKAALTDRKELIDIHHAGTAMRFLTAFFASKPGRTVTITGSQRMQERPIEILVDALKTLGAKIEYLATPGCPPLKIEGREFELSQVQLPAHVSSQYITALLLVAPSLEKGLRLTLNGKITSLPYIEMTLSLLKSIGVEVNFDGQTIEVKSQKKIASKTIRVESDWSSASYFFSLAALASEAEVVLESYTSNSLQGDSVLQEIYSHLGVESNVEDHQLTLRKGTIKTRHLSWDLTSAPDIAQTIAVTCFGMGIGCDLTGLHTLKIKETDRLEAMATELKKFGAEIRVTTNSLHLQPCHKILHHVEVDTYNDHRMAMAFAPLALQVPLAIRDAEVVSKSYPDFWNDWRSLGFRVDEK